MQINASICSKPLRITALWMLKLFLFSPSRKINLLYVCLFTYYDLVNYTFNTDETIAAIDLVQWSRNTCLRFLKMRVKETSGSASMNLAAVLPADTQEIWPLSVCLPETLGSSWAATDHRLLSFWVGNESLREWRFAAPWLLKYRLGGLCTDTQLHAAAMLHAAGIWSGDIAAPASLG